MITEDKIENKKITVKKTKKLTKNKSSFSSLQHQFLIATPLVQDDVFRKSVIYLCEHTENGAIGLIINHPIDCSLEFVFKQMKIDVTASEEEVNDIPVMMGGPLHQEHGFVLHRDTGEKWRTSLKFSDTLSVTTSHDVLEAIAAGSGPKDVMLILGYSAWESGQLEEELASNSWLTCPADFSVLFDVPLDDRWKKASDLLGFNMSFLSMDVGHA